MPFGDFPEVALFSTTGYIPKCATQDSVMLVAKPNLQYDPSALSYQWNSWAGGQILGDSLNDTIYVKNEIWFYKTKKGPKALIVYVLKL